MNVFDEYRANSAKYAALREKWGGVDEKIDQFRANSQKAIVSAYHALQKAGLLPGTYEFGLLTLEMDRKEHGSDGPRTHIEELPRAINLMRVGLSKYLDTRKPITADKPAAEICEIAAKRGIPVEVHVSCRDNGMGGVDGDLQLRLKLDDPQLAQNPELRAQALLRAFAAYAEEKGQPEIADEINASIGALKQEAEAIVRDGVFSRYDDFQVESDALLGATAGTFNQFRDFQLMVNDGLRKATNAVLHKAKLGHRPEYDSRFGWSRHGRTETAPSAFAIKFGEENASAECIEFVEKICNAAKSATPPLPVEPNVPGRNDPDFIPGAVGIRVSKDEAAKNPEGCGSILLKALAAYAREIGSTFTATEIIQATETIDARIEQMKHGEAIQASRGAGVGVR